MNRVKFGDIVKDVKVNVDRQNNPYEFYIAGDHMDSEDLTIHRKGRFATDDVGPAFFEQRLLPFIMLSDSSTSWSISKSKGSTNPYVLFSDLADYEFDLPSLEEHSCCD